MEEKDVEKLADSLVNAKSQEEIDVAQDQVLKLTEDVKCPKEMLDEPDKNEEEPNSIESNLINLKPREKIKLALIGNSFVRARLIRDSLRIVALCVLRNNKLTEREILKFARSSDLDDDVYRRICANRSWMNTYEIKTALAANPKTPIAIAVGLVKFLQTHDLRRLSQSKDTSHLVSAHARRTLDLRKKKKN